MATYTKFQKFVQDLANGVHDFSSDQITVALTNSAPSATDTVLANITQIDYTGLSSRNITTTSSTQTSGTYSLVLEDLTLTASGAIPTFRYVVFYNNDAPNDELIGYYDHGTGITLASGETYKIDLTEAQKLFELT